MKRIVILGGGQLAYMLGLASQPLGLECVSVSSEANCPANHSIEVKVADYDDPTLTSYYEQFDVLTFENENIEVDNITKLCLDIQPPSQAIVTAQDRLLEKKIFANLKIPTVRFHNVTNARELTTAIDELHCPSILKTRRQGYDGKGQFWLDNPAQQELAWQSINQQIAVLEVKQNFSQEVSQIAVRAKNGDIKFYPLTCNVHCHGILHYSVAPFLDTQLQQQAQSYVLRLLEALDYVGVLAVEFFVVNGQLIANEMAPRVHNSGHWTIEGAQTSQFENHLRAICGLPLGATEAIGYSAMINCIGHEPVLDKELQYDGIYYHTYFKTPRPGRKLAHVTVHCADATTRDAHLNTLLERIGAPT